MEERNCLLLAQNRKDGIYSNFLSKYYRLSAAEKFNFDNLPIDFIYFEPSENGDGEFYGYGKIVNPPFEDSNQSGYFFVEVSNYKPFSKIVIEKSSIKDFSITKVKTIEPLLLDEICLDGGVTLNFKADSHLVQVLGEQLIASERVGILELVKNAFDANASYCHVKIEKVPGLIQISDTLNEFNQLEGPVIIIEDNGSGMSKDQIEHGWLRPASTLKTNLKERLKNEKIKALKDGKLEIYENFVKQLKAEHKGRIPLGEKGVGRFATHRLGKKLILKTKTFENDYELVLKINWDDFDVKDGIVKDLDSIGITLTKEPLSRKYDSSNSGTQIIIYGGRDGLELTENEIKEINNSILKLNSPNPNPASNKPEFKATFACLQIKDLENAIIHKRNDQVFRIYGIVDENGVFEFDYFFTPPYNDKIPLNGFELLNRKEDLKKFNKNYFLESINGVSMWKKPKCGQFYIHLDVWYRDNPWMSKNDPFLGYLKEYGGLSIYRDGLNIYPAEWGTKYDWLGLKQNQISQASRISYYHMLGNVEIEQSNNIELIDKTNREGMIVNTAFRDLTELVKCVVSVVEKDYMGKRDELNKLTGGLIREPRKLNEFTKQSVKIINNIHDKYDLASDPYLLLTELGDISERKKKLVDLANSSKNLQKNLELMAEVQDMLTEQAGFGLGIAVALHEINKVTSNFYFGILEVIKKGEFDRLKLEDLKNTSAALESELNRVGPLRALRNERDVVFNVSKSIEYVISIFQWQFEKNNIDCAFNLEEDFQITARFGALNQILTNLIDNACYWLNDPNIMNRKIRIVLNSKQRSIIVADNGPGFSDSILPYLFQPGYSLKEPQSGLGLYVCKHYMNLMKKRGDIYLVKEHDRLKDMTGAQFLLDFSKVN
jgi:signal transduction histidine kinase